MNALKSNIIYKYHYFDKKIIQKGDVVLDIGANLGYDSNIFRLAPSTAVAPGLGSTSRGDWSYGATAEATAIQFARRNCR